MKALLALFAIVLISTQAQLEGGWKDIDPSEALYDDTWNHFLYFGLNKAVDQAYQSGLLRTRSVIVSDVYSAKVQVVNGLNVKFAVEVLDLASSTYRLMEYVVYAAPGYKDMSLVSYKFVSEFPVFNHIHDSEFAYKRTV